MPENKCIYKNTGQCPTTSSCLGDLCVLEEEKDTNSSPVTPDDTQQEGIIGLWRQGKLDRDITLRDLLRTKI